MDFARKQLEKYGWIDGKGLGKNENGISQALKPKLKRSMTGVGHDAASDYTEHWWSTLYDKAANNIQVKEKDGFTKKIKTKDDANFEITNSTWKLKRKKSKQSNVKPQEQYQDFFVRTAVLGSGGSKTERVRESDSESEENDVQNDVFKMTDEDLFAACEGRTAHKGARHGLKALGKLARIEQQEKLLLQQSRFSGYSHGMGVRCTKNSTDVQVENKEYEEDIMEVASLNCDENVSVVKKKKKKKKHCSKQENYECGDSERNDYFVNNFTTKKQKKNSADCDISAVFDAGNTDFEDVAKKVNTTDKRELHGGKPKKTKLVDLQSDILSSGKKDKKMKHLDAFDSDNSNTDDKSCKLILHKKNKKIVCN